MNSSHDSPRFHVGMPSEVVRQRIRNLLQIAISRGDGSEFIAALKQINERLKSNADRFGEPRRYYQNAHLEYRIGIVAPIFNIFGVHDFERDGLREVLISEVGLLDRPDGFDSLRN